MRPMRTAPVNRLLLTVCGWAGIGGALAAVLSNIIGSALVPGHDWVANTISDLAAGRYEIIQDLGLYAFAGSLLACGLGTAHIHPGTNRWTGGVLALAIMAALVTVIGARNEYGDDDAVATWGVHLGMVYALMLLFVATALVMAPGLSRLSPGHRTGSLICAGLFVAGALAYFLSPTGYDGLVERMLVLVAVAWVVLISRLLLRLGAETLP